MTAFIRRLLGALLLALAGAAGAEPPQSPLDLLEEVRTALAAERQERQIREGRFVAGEAEAARRLEEARRALAQEQAQIETLRREFDTNRTEVQALRAKLTDQSGDLRQLRDAFQQVAGSTRALLKDSLVTSQRPERQAELSGLLQLDGLPPPQALRRLWVLLQEEMTETGRTVQYRAAVNSPDGRAEDTLVTRVGGFTAVAGERFLRYRPALGALEEAAPQPALAHRRIAAAFADAADGGLHTMTIDPTGGAVLGLLAKVPGLMERLRQGRVIGYIILGVGALGLLLALERLAVLLLEARRMHRQKGSDTPDPRNALGRVMQAWEEHRHLPPEALEMKLDQVVLRDTPRLQRGLGTLRLCAVIAPMLGLLGTVTGLIDTFHSITLFGAGDARLMAGGISQALVTTALGLSTAIPLLLLHSLLAARSRALVTVLDEQSAGIIAAHGAPAGVARHAA